MQSKPGSLHDSGIKQSREPTDALVAEGALCVCAQLNRSRGVCLPEIQRVCSDAFVEGFKKGVKWLQQKQKEV